MSDEAWGYVPEMLAELKVPFCAIYGAEPMLRMGALKNFIGECNAHGIGQTLITNARLLTDKTINELKSYGLDSITVSFDGQLEHPDKYIRAKSKAALSKLLQLRRAFSDVEVIFTLGHNNIGDMIKVMETMSAMDVWMFFDIVHPHRGQEGSKCFNSDFTPLLMHGDESKIKQILNKVIIAKEELGAKIHNSVEQLTFFRDYYPMVTNFNWTCTTGAWITIDHDGSVFGCDDYQPGKARGKYLILDYGLKWDWNDWVEYNKKNFNCPGCFWATHYMASQHYKRADTKWISELTHRA